MESDTRPAPSQDAAAVRAILDVIGHRFAGRRAGPLFHRRGRVADYPAAVPHSDQPAPSLRSFADDYRRVRARRRAGVHRSRVRAPAAVPRHHRTPRRLVAHARLPLPRNPSGPDARARARARRRPRAGSRRRQRLDGTATGRLVPRHRAGRGCRRHRSGRAARRRGSRASPAISKRCPCARGSFDAVVAAASLHYAVDVRAVLTEAARVLRPGGVLIVADSPVYDDDVARDDGLAANARPLRVVRRRAPGGALSRSDARGARRSRTVPLRHGRPRDDVVAIGSDADGAARARTRAYRCCSAGGADGT